MKQTLLVAVILGAVTQAQTDDHAHHHDPVPQRGDQIVVTINPEARVSAVIAAPMPPPPKCGEAIDLNVRIINQGYVTAPLQANIEGDGKRRVALHIDAAKLSGGPTDVRQLRLIPLAPGMTDVTVAFSIETTAGDLGGRDRVHLLVRCVAPD